MQKLLIYTPKFYWSYYMQMKHDIKMRIILLS